MKKKISILACLLFFSLACLSTAAVIDEQPSAEVISSPTVTIENNTLTPTLSQVGEGEVEPQICAVVTAETAAHLRDTDSPGARILDHLRSGEEVQLLDATGAAWWRVKHGDDIGFVKAVYLKKTECVK